jgi:glutamate/aspartate transport system permease protein
LGSAAKFNIKRIKIMNLPWAWSIFEQVGPDGAGTYLNGLVSGIYWTAATALVAAIIALSLGTLIGIMRTLPSRSCRAISATYVEIFRDIPLLVQMFVWFFVVPELLPTSIGSWIKSWEWGPFITAAVSLGFYATARIAEQVRASINSLPPGQLGAGLALGLSPRLAYKLVLLPQAIRVVLPPLTSELINIVKNTSVGMTIGLMELTARSREMQEMSFHTFEAFGAATVGYLLVNFAVVGLMRLIEISLHRESNPVADKTVKGWAMPWQS